MHERQTIIWDWNGTLLDDIDVCTASINRMLHARRLPELSREGYRNVFGFPVRDYYMAIGFDFSQEPWNEAAMEFIALYHESQPTCQLAEGAEEALAFFQSRGYRQAILSAMEHTSLIKSVQARGITPYFDRILGIDDHYAAGKIDNARRFFRENQLIPEQVTLIGDTLHDAEVATELGCRCVLVASGHQSEERLVKAWNPVIPDLVAVPPLFS